MTTSGSGRVWLGTEAGAYGAGADDERRRWQMLLEQQARISELEALARDMLAAFGQGFAYGHGKWSTRSEWVDKDRLERWKSALGWEAMMAGGEPQ